MVQVYFNLDFSANKEQYINVSQYDDKSRTIKIALYNNGERVELDEDSYVYIKVLKPDGNIVLNDCRIEDNCAVFDITQQETAAYGNGKCEIFILKNDEVLYTTTFLLRIKKSVYKAADIISSSEYQTLERMLIYVEELIKNIDVIIENVNKQVQELIDEAEEEMNAKMSDFDGQVQELLDEAVAEMNNKISAFNDKVEALDDKIDEFNETVDGYEEYYTEKIAIINEKIDSLEGTIDDFITETREKIDEAISNLAIADEEDVIDMAQRLMDEDYPSV